VGAPFATCTLAQKDLKTAAVRRTLPIQEGRAHELR